MGFRASGSFTCPRTEPCKAPTARGAFTLRGRSPGHRAALLRNAQLLLCFFQFLMVACELSGYFTVAGTSPLLGLNHQPAIHVSHLFAANIRLRGRRPWLDISSDDLPMHRADLHEFDLTRPRNMAVGEPAKASRSRIPRIHHDCACQPVVPSLPCAIGENSDAAEKQCRNAQGEYDRSDACRPSTDRPSNGTLDTDTENCHSDRPPADRPLVREVGELPDDQSGDGADRVFGQGEGAGSDQLYREGHQRASRDVNRPRSQAVHCNCSEPTHGSGVLALALYAHLRRLRHVRDRSALHSRRQRSSLSQRSSRRAGCVHLRNRGNLFRTEGEGRRTPSQDSARQFRTENRRVRPPEPEGHRGSRWGSPPST